MLQNAVFVLKEDTLNPDFSGVSALAFRVVRLHVVVSFLRC
jgi:hypothetical protein